MDGLSGSVQDIQARSWLVRPASARLWYILLGALFIASILALRVILAFAGPGLWLPVLIGFALWLLAFTLFVAYGPKSNRYPTDRPPSRWDHFP